MNYSAIGDTKELKFLVEKILKDGVPFGFDIETGYLGEDRERASLHPEEGFVVGFSFTNDLTWARYVPIGHDNKDINFDSEEVWGIFQPLLESGLAVAHNTPFESRFLRKVGIDIKWFSDSIIEIHTIGTVQRKNLKEAVEDIFDHKMIQFMELFPDADTPAKRRAVRFNQLGLDPKTITYACEDAVWCLALHRKYYEQLKGNFIYKLEMKIIPVVVEMEENGVLYDWDFMREAAIRAKAFNEKLYLEIYQDLSRDLGKDAIEFLSSYTKKPPKELNLSSFQQVGRILFDGLGLPVDKKTDSGKPSTDAVALSRLASQHRSVKKLLWWRELRKLSDTYLDKYPSKFSYAPDGRTHPSLNQTAVPAGRFSVDNPPYQQTPKEYGKPEGYQPYQDEVIDYLLDSGESFYLNFRDCIVASPGHYLIGFDYSQIELHWLAGEANEGYLINAYATGQDVHLVTAALMLKKAIEDVTDDDRSKGKTMNFALLYGIEVKALALRLAISEEEAQILYNAYFSAFTAIESWMSQVKTFAQRNGHVFTKFGRKVPIWEYTSDNWKLRSKGDRLAVNAPIQGGASDYVKLAMVRVHKLITGSEIKMIMNIHDALYFEVPFEIHPDEVVDKLTPAIIFPIPDYPDMEVEWSVGLRWGSMKKYLPEGPDNASVITRKASALPESESGRDDSSEVLQSLTESLPESKTILVYIAEIPSRNGFLEFLGLIPPGNDKIKIITPQGFIDIAGTYSLSRSDEPRLKQIIPSTTITYAEDTVDKTLISDLSFND